MNNIIKLKIREIDSFKDHPFKVVNDDSLMQLAQSIKDNGLLVPIVVRKKEDNRYEIISGHRRKAAVELNGEEYIDAIIKDLTYDEAVIEMVDSNMYRDKILPSEKAFAYKMKLDAMKHQGKKISPKGTKSQSINEIDDTKTQIYRYVRLTNLIPELLKLVDDTVLKDPALLTLGVGTHLDPEVAAIRALTEVAQSRATQIHGTREDTNRAVFMRKAGYQRMKRINKHWFGESRDIIEISDIKNRAKKSFKEDIETSLKLLSKQDFDQVLFTDLTRSEIQIPVVRVVIPGMEVYSVDVERIGKRLRNR